MTLNSFIFKNYELKIKLFPFFALIFFSYGKGIAQRTEESKALLEEVSSKIASFDNIQFDFSYLLENRQENIRQETKGNVTLAGERYKLNFQQTTQLFDGTKIYTIVPENEEITITTKEDGEDFGINPQKLLVFYKEGYTFQWDIKQYVLGRPIQFIKLTPIEENKDIKYLLLGIDLQQKLIYRLIEIGTNDTRTTLTLSKIKTNVELPPRFFTFDPNKYPDYYINQ